MPKDMGDLHQLLDALGIRPFPGMESRPVHFHRIVFREILPGQLPCECNIGVTINNTPLMFSEETLIEFRDLVVGGVNKYLQFLHKDEDLPATLPCVVCRGVTTREDAIQLSSGGWIHTDDCKKATVQVGA